MRNTSTPNAVTISRLRLRAFVRAWALLLALAAVESVVVSVGLILLLVVVPTVAGVPALPAVWIAAAWVVICTWRAVVGRRRVQRYIPVVDDYYDAGGRIISAFDLLKRGSTLNAFEELAMDDAAKWIEERRTLGLPWVWPSKWPISYGERFIADRALSESNVRVAQPTNTRPAALLCLFVLILMPGCAKPEHEMDAPQSVELDVAPQDEGYRADASPDRRQAKTPSGESTRPEEKEARESPTITADSPERSSASGDTQADSRQGGQNGEDGATSTNGKPAPGTAGGESADAGSGESTGKSESASADRSGRDTSGAGGGDAAGQPRGRSDAQDAATADSPRSTEPGRSAHGDASKADQPPCSGDGDSSPQKGAKARADSKTEARADPSKDDDASTDAGGKLAGTKRERKVGDHKPVRATKKEVRARRATKTRSDEQVKADGAPVKILSDVEGTEFDKGADAATAAPSDADIDYEEVILDELQLERLSPADRALVEQYLRNLRELSGQKKSSGKHTTTQPADKK